MTNYVSDKLNDELYPFNLSLSHNQFSNTQKKYMLVVNKLQQSGA